MQAKEVKSILNREPFVPLKLVRSNGKSLDIPFRHVMLPMRDTVIVFKGIESATSHYAKNGYEHVNYDSIERLEPVSRRASKKKNGKSHRRRKPE